MEESAPSSYDEQPPPPPPSTGSQQAPQQRENQEQTGYRSESISDSRSEEGTYDTDSASDASYTESYTSDLEGNPASEAFTGSLEWNPSRAPVIGPYRRVYHEDVYQRPTYYSAPIYGTQSYSQPNPQFLMMGASHNPHLDRQSSQGWTTGSRRYGDHPQSREQRYPGHPEAPGDPYSSHQHYSFPPRRAPSSELASHSIANPIGEEGGFVDWGSRQQNAPQFTRTRELPLLERPQFQYDPAVSHHYAHRGRVLEEFPVLEQSHWIREMAPTPGQLEQLIAQFPSLLGDITHGPDGPGQQNPNLYPRLRVNTTLWEAETTVCIVVEIDQRSVSRRCDNNMINGTKLLNVARISRGRRDGILKGEKVRKVVKVGNMNNKGVWIPFERALEIAQREDILESLYPLFVSDLNPLLFSPSNQSRLKQMLLKGAQKNPEFRKWFHGIPTARAQAQQRAQHKPMFQPLSHSQSQSQSHRPQPQMRTQTQTQLHAHAPGYEQTSRSRRPPAGPGLVSADQTPTASSSRSHRRTRSQQQQHHKSTSVQKQHTRWRGHSRDLSAFARYAEEGHFARTAGDPFSSRSEAPYTEAASQEQGTVLTTLPSQHQVEDESRLHPQLRLQQSPVPSPPPHTPPESH